MTEKLEVDCFEIDIETLYDTTDRSRYRLTRRAAMGEVVLEVIKNLTQDSKKRFEEYQEQNDPCK